MSVLHTVERDGVVGVAKRIRPDQRANPVYHSLMQVEAAALGRVRHPAVIRLLDHGEDWLILEPAAHHATCERITDWAAAEALLTRVRDALVACHRAGVLHRDPKLENVLCTERGWVLADFGAAALQNHPDPAPALGTPASMAPERLAGQAATEASDTFAFGVLAFTVLAGKSPYPARWDRLLLAHSARPPRLVPRFWVPEHAQDFVNAAIHAEPARRPPLARWVGGAQPR